MKTVTRWLGSLILLALGVTVLPSQASAAGGGGKHGGGGGHAAAPRAHPMAMAQPRAHVNSPPARQAAPRQVAPRTYASTARSSSKTTRTNTNNRASAANHRASATNNRGNATNNLATSRSRVAGSSTSVGVGVRGATGTVYTPRSRGYRGYSYGRRYLGAGQGVAGVVSRLRSAHRTLAALDHDYAGHRVQAMHAIHRAIRQLTHRSTWGLVNTSTSTIRGGIAATRRTMPLTQAQSDARMRRVLQTLHQVDMHLTAHAYTSSHVRARNWVERGMHEVNVALGVR